MSTSFHRVSLWVANLLMVTVTAHVSAAPFLTVSLTARLTGSGNPFTSSIDVATGQTYDYQVAFLLAPVGTSNVHPSGTTGDTIGA